MSSNCQQTTALTKLDKSPTRIIAAIILIIILQTGPFRHSGEMSESSYTETSHTETSEEDRELFAKIVFIGEYDSGSLFDESNLFAKVLFDFCLVFVFF